MLDLALAVSALVGAGAALLHSRRTAERVARARHLAREVRFTLVRELHLNGHGDAAHVAERIATLLDVALK